MCCCCRLTGETHFEIAARGNQLKVIHREFTLNFAVALSFELHLFVTLARNFHLGAPGSARLVGMEHSTPPEDGLQRSSKHASDEMGTLNL